MLHNDGSIDFHLSDGRQALVLPYDVVQEMLRICRFAGQVETGGILLGKYDEAHTCALVHRITGPPPDSRHFFARFFRGVAGMQELLDGLWTRKERLFYLGEWHHHPLPIPDPSPSDLTQMNEIAANKNYACPEPILLILSGSPTQDWQLSATLFTHRGEVFTLSAR